MASWLNQTIMSRYRIEGHLGQGGMAEVYKAWDVRRNYYVALKVLREDLAQGPDILGGFESEAQLLASLAHANIVRFYSFERERSLAFIVMDYVEGMTLRQHIQAARGYSLSLEIVNSVVEQVCAALHYAHAEGVIHRDVKPSNIILRPDGQVLLSDFGIAQAIGAGAALSLEGGTPAYMAPEQLRGEGLDARTDIYSLGLVVYEMLAGRRPFLGDSRGTRGSLRDRVRWEHLHTEPPSLSHFNPALPEGIARLITQALAKNPATRPATALAFWQRWQAAIAEPAPAHQLPQGSAIRTPMLPLPVEVQRSQPAVSGTPVVRQGGLKLDRRVIAGSVTVLVILIMVGLLATALGTRATSVPMKLRPGIIQVGQCFTHTVATGVQSIFCVEQVTVQPDSSLKFDVSWTGQYQDETYQLKKGSDAANKNMYLIDNLGYRYNHTKTGGAAAAEVVLIHQQKAAGWFLFPPPAPGATTFTFHDEDLGQVIGGINLSR